jgi:hypothetical protein
MTKFPSYAIGTVSIDASATIVVGAGGPLWTSTTNVRPGDDLVVAGQIVIVEDVIDDAHLEIDAWPFAAVPAGTPYKIVQRSPLRFSGAEASADVIKLVAALNTEGLPLIVPAAAAAPDPSLGEENQFATQPATGKLWLKTGGAWVFQGIYKGFNPRGVFDNAAAYSPGDYVTFGEASYVYVNSTPGSGHAPPDPTFWQLLAAKGDKGDTGATGASYAATSTTSFAIGICSKAFATQEGLAYLPGARVRMASAANVSNYMEGLVTSYSGPSLVVGVSKASGAGTFADWNINIAGDPGSGDMLSTNNLSDVASKKSAMDNLSVHGADMAAADTLNLEVATGNFVHVTGDTAITAITLADGHQRTIYFSGAPLLTNGASLVLPGGANIRAAPGDIAVFVADGSIVRCSDYLPASQTNARALINAAASPTSRTRTVLTSGSGTYITPTGCKAILVRMIGAGGGGGGGSDNNLNAGGGGNGGDTTFTNVITLKAGGGPGGAGSGGAAVPGGTATGGDINIAGGSGSSGFGAGFGAGPSTSSTGSIGGNSAFGGSGVGGWPGNPGAGGSSAQNNSGSGGGGGGGFIGSSAAGGGSAGSGAYLEKLIPSPAASYSYAVGAGGSPGNPGSGGGAGGKGGSGIIIIDEFY